MTTDDLFADVRARMGVLPGFFALAGEDPPVARALVEMARVAYLDNPLPAQLKERLFVHLSRYCPSPYCLARHTAFLLGRGHVAGDPEAGVSRPADLADLLSEDEAGPGAVTALLAELWTSPPVAVDRLTGGQERLVRTAAARVLRRAGDSAEWAEGLRRLLGPVAFGRVMLLTAFVRAAHLWTEAHPELGSDEDVRALLADDPDLGDLLSRATVTRGGPARDPAGDEASESAGVASFHVPADPGLPVDVGPGVRRLFGLPADGEARTTDFLARVHPDDRDRVSATIATSLKVGTGHYVEYRVVRRDGDVVWVASRTEPVTGPDGRVTGLRGALVDVTERRQAEEAVRLQAQLLDAVEQAVVATDLDGHILYWNRYAETLYGWRADEVLGRPVHEVTPSAATVEQAREIMESLAAGGVWQGEFEVRRKDGGTFLAHVTDSPVTVGGRQIGIVGVSVDVTERRRVEALLRESEARFRGTFENAAVGMAHVDVPGRFVRVNDTFCAVTGYPRSELTTLTWRDITHPDDLGTDEEGVAELLAGGRRAHVMDKRYLRADGSVVWVRLTVTLSRDAAGQPEHFIAVVEDITARREAEEAVRASEVFTRRVLDGLFTFVGVLTPDGTVVEANRAPLEAAGLSPEDVIGRKFWDCYWWDYAPDVRQRLRDAVRRAAVGEVVRYDTPIRVAGDGRLWIDLQLSPLVDDAGRVTHVIPSGTDLSGRKQAEDALRESERRFRETADHLPLLVWVHGPDGAQQWVNDTFCRYFGVSREDMLADRWQLLTHPEDGTGYVEEFLRCVRERTEFHGEVRVRRGDGDWRWLESWGRPRLDAAGQYLGHIGTSLDVTERKAAEQALREREAVERRQRARAELLADVLADLERVAGWRARAQCLVELLVARLADAATVESADAVPGVALAAARRDPAAPPHTRLTVPLVLGHDEQGSLVIARADPARPAFTTEDLDLLGEVAERAGLLLASARLREDEHEIAVRLQRALLPDDVARPTGVLLAARYEAAGDLLEVGGDWYDSYDLGDGRVGLVVGDVVGHGLESAAAMGRMRAALAALAPRSADPGRLLTDLDDFAHGPNGVPFATACCVVLDAVTGTLTHASAGHPPPLLVTPDGDARFLAGGRSAPLGVLARGSRPVERTALPPGSLLVLYSDGLVERRGESITDGLARLRVASRDLAASTPQEACDRLVTAARSAGPVTDDIVVLCARSIAAPEVYRRRFRARAEELSPMRRSLDEWMAQRQVSARVRRAVLLGASEASANAIEHAYPPGSEGDVDVEISGTAGGGVVVTVRDRGTWRPPEPRRDRRRGTGIMRSVGTAFSRTTGPGGTTVTFRVDEGVGER